jgi:hypothetical protein
MLAGQAVLMTACMLIPSKKNSTTMYVFLGEKSHFKPLRRAKSELVRKNPLQMLFHGSRSLEIMNDQPIWETSQSADHQ